MLENFAIVLITGEVTVRNYSSLPTNICMTQGMTFPKGTRSQKLVLPRPHNSSDVKVCYSVSH